jgi:hypothetical protein
MECKIAIPRSNVVISTTKDIVINTIEKEPGVYLFYNNMDQIMYIGKASNMRNRIMSHILGNSNTADVCHNFSKVECIYVDDPTDRDIYETYLINTLQPPLNIEKVFSFKSQRFSDEYQLQQTVTMLKEQKQQLHESLREKIQNRAFKYNVNINNIREVSN